MAHITLSQLTTVLQRIVSWATGKFAAKNTYSGKIEYADMPVVVLASMGIELDGTSTQRPMNAGSTYYLPAGQGAGARIMFVDSNGGAVKISNPVSNVIYCNAYTGLLYRWDESESDMVPVGGDVDGLRKVYVGNNDFSSLDTLYSGVYQVIDQSIQRIIGVLVASSDDKFGANPYFVTQWLFSNLVLSDEYSGSFNGYYITGRAHIIHRFYNASNPSSDIPLNTWSEWKVYGLTLDELSGLLNSKVSSVSVNGTNHTPNSSGVVDLGTIQGAKGDKGDTVVIDPEGLEQFTIANDLDTSDPTQGLSARQGKILKGNVDALWAKVNALINDLAAMAFTGTKTQGLGNIDWTGGTFYATVVKNLTGCTATDNTTNGQLVEGQTLTMQLTASSGFALTGATISVTNSKGQSVAYTLNGNTLSVANVMGTITISVVAVAVYSVVNNDTHATLSNSTPTNPTHGGSWSGTLSAASGYGLSATPSVTMGGVAVDFTATGNSWNRSTGAMTIGNVTGNIVILEAAVEVVAHTVTKKLLNMTSSNTTGDTTDPDFGYKMQSVEDGSRYSTTLAAVSGATSNNDVVVKMGGVDITSQVLSDNTITIPSVTGDVTIIATAHTGNVIAKANASGTTLTINHGGTSSTLTCDTDNGDGTFSGFANIGDDAITTLSFSNKSAFLSFDFGGSVATSLGNAVKFGGFSAANACSSLTSIKGLVLKQNDLETIVGYCPLTDIDTIGWGLNGVSSLYCAFASTNLTSLDIEDFDVLQGCPVRRLADGSSALSRIKLPHMPYIETLNTSFKGTALTNIVISAGSGITSIENCFGSCSNLSLVDISDVIITSLLASIAFAFNGAKSGITLKIGEFDMSGVTTSTVHGMNRITNLICTTTTPQNSAMFTYLTALTAIYVPDVAVADYKSAWSDKASIIHSINDYTE